jgi:nucleotide-binding universal stress UspA family protein
MANTGPMRILLPMKPDEDSTDLLHLIRALFPPSTATLRRLYVHRPADLDIYMPEMFAALPDVEKANAEAEAAASSEANKSSEPFRAAGYEVDIAVRPGVAASEILEDAKQWKAALIVVRTSSANSDEERISSVVSSLMYNSPIPVLTYRHAGEGMAISRILLPTDLSENSKQAAEFGLTLAAALGVEADLLHVVLKARLPDLTDHGAAALKEADRWLESVRSRIGARASASVHEARSVFDGVTEFCAEKKSSIIVLSANGRSAAAAVLFGKNARRIVRNSGSPVLVIPTNNSVKPEEFVAPLKKS